MKHQAKMMVNLDHGCLQAYGKREAGALARSILHWLLRTSAYGGDGPKSVKPHTAKAGLGGKGLEPRRARSYPAWVPQPRMLAAAVGLPLDGPSISPEVDMFIEQAVIAVSRLNATLCAAITSGAQESVPVTAAWCSSKLHQHHIWACCMLLRVAWVQL